MIRTFKDKLIILACVVAFMAISGVVTGLSLRESGPQSPLEIAAAMRFPRDKITIETASGQTYPFDVELALTPEQQRQGMMWRQDMDDGAGMLFIFEASGQKSFWMKNTLIPLDIIHIAENGIIAHIHHEAKPRDETPLTSSVPTKAVLEIKGGLADKLEIRVGDRVVHPVFR